MIWFMPDDSANKYNDPVRQFLVAEIHRQQTDMRTVSLKAGLNHAYIQQFIKSGKPIDLPEKTRGKIAEALGVDEALLRPKRVGTAQTRAAATHYSQQATLGSIPILG